MDISPAESPPARVSPDVLIINRGINTVAAPPVDGIYYAMRAEPGLAKVSP